jgi:dihydroxy-acid dehydratase
VGVPLSLDDFQAVADRTPFIANLFVPSAKHTHLIHPPAHVLNENPAHAPPLPNRKPSGEFVMEDMARIGGTPAVLKYLLAKGRLHGGALTCTGRTLADTLAPLPGVTGWGPLGPAKYVPGAALPPTASERILRPLEDPIKATGHITVLRGSVAPEGSVAKITGKEGVRFTGAAAVFDSEATFLEALAAGELHARLGRPLPPAPGAAAAPPARSPAATAERLVCVIRYEGPKGGPGMPEMLTPTSAIMGAGLGDVCAMITDGRFSGGSHGFIVGHVAPEAAEGGPIALLMDGDEVTIDGVARTISAGAVSEGEWARRRATWKRPAPRVTSGVLRKFVANTTSASKGCVTDAL